MNWTPALTRLRDILAYLYPDETSARRITTEAGLAQPRIDFSGASANCWHSILEEALKLDGLAALVERAREEYPGNHDLADAWQAYLTDFASPTRPFPHTPIPRIWNVPHLRNPNFTGREDLLEQLHAALTSGQPAALTQAISGLGGVGKTQLATEYCYRHAGEYELVWWVRAEEPATLAADYALLATELELPGRENPDQHAVVEAVKRWLRAGGNWLLVFDNAPQPEDVSAYLPGAGGHVLITSRSQHWAEVACLLDVQVFAAEEAMAFLKLRTGQTDDAAARELADELGYLPLALDQAAAFIVETKGTLADYLALYCTRYRELWRKRPRGAAYQETVATTWEISFRRLQEENPAAADLLNLCAFMAPDDILQDMIVAGANLLPQPLAAAAGDPLQFAEAIAALRGYSLVQGDGENLSVHRLVQAVTRERLNVKDRQIWAGAAIRLVDHAYPYQNDEPTTWPGSARLLPHALVVTECAEQLEMVGETAGRLLNQVSLYLSDRADLAGARKVIERALRIAEQAYGPEHPHVATCVNNLGSVLQDLGDPAEARACFERAQRIIEHVYGPEHPDVARCANSLGSVLQDLGDLAEAKRYCERALRIAERIYGPEHPTLATYVNNLGSVLRAQGDLVGARACYERALAIGAKTLGPEHRNVAIRLSNLGSVLQGQGDLAGARACFEQALAIFRTRLGEDHPYTRAVRGALESLG